MRVTMKPVPWMYAFLMLGLLYVSSGDMEPTFKHCCNLGMKRAIEELTCHDFPAPVIGVPPEQQSICLSAVEICCLKKHREQQCEIGKGAARSGTDCLVASTAGGEYRKDCCEACKLGLISGSMGMGCIFKNFAFGIPWDGAYRDCCVAAQPFTTSPAHVTSPTTLSKDKKTTVIPTPILDSLCDLLPGELCAHICVPIPGSFRCLCHEGFTLMADGKSCQHDDLPNRCKMNNPCAHKCLDTGVAIECSCHPGYQLAIDERSCNDIDECALGIHTCEPDIQMCQNDPGSYTCVNKDGSVSKPVLQEAGKPGAPNAFDAGKCPVGYQYNFQSQVCDDIDECLLKTADCGINSGCQNTIGSFKCVRKPVESCPPGYQFDDQLQSCADVDECSKGLDNCQRDGLFCVNTIGNYTCQARKDSQCPAGYKYNKTLLTCEDVDECVENLHGCVPDLETCRNTIGAYECDISCETGYQYSLSHRMCIDVNECEEGTHVCNLATEACLNEPGGYRCGQRNSSTLSQCQPGFKYSEAPKTCVDINECVESAEPVCDSNQDCENAVGSYVCTCKEGFQLDPVIQACVDINECQVNKHNCLPSQRCDNTIGSFHCIRFTSCGTGYTLNAQTGQCEDDDECTLGTDNCRTLGPMWQCRNTFGSFRCERKRCDPKQVLLSNGECKPLECPPGYDAAHHGQCIDINECERNNPCRRNQHCINTPGSYRCVNLLNCPAGYELNDSGNRCLDIDECSKSTHDCKQGQQCINSPGGFICQCPQGHSLNHDKECIDIDECARFSGQICAINSECHNTVGSYRCICKEGFKQDPKGGNSCVDIDECTESPGLCHQNCINIWGSYRCSCNLGFTLQVDNRTCKDIDECEQFKDRNLCVGICVNQPGSYSCQCPDGYRLGNNGHTCQDIDECLGGNVCRNPNEICLNTRGSYRCNTIQCPPHFVKDPEHKNRCKRETLYCREGDTECLQLPTSYSFNFITFVSNLAIPQLGYIDLFTMRGPLWSGTNVRFKLEMLDSRAPVGIIKTTKDSFQLRRTAINQAIISLVNSIEGPQEIELQLTMELFHSGIFGGAAVAKLYIFVSQYEF